MPILETTPDATIEITQTINGKPFKIGIRGALQLRDKNLYIGEHKIFDIFGKNGQSHSGYTEYNHVDITKYGRALFDMPEEWTSHLTKVRVTL